MTTVSTVQIGSPETGLSVVLNRFCKLFNELDSGNLHKLQEVYGEDVRFQDPFSQVSGLDQLTEYFAGAYGNVIRCQFRFSDPMIDGCHCTIPWVMELQHKRLNGGRQVTVDGISVLEIRDGRVRYHRDYFDAGQLIYENLPLLGGVIRWIKEKAG